MGFTVSIPVSNLAAANATLVAAGRGACFTVPVYTGGALPAFATLSHIGNDAAFRAACAALPGAVVRDYADRQTDMNATAAALGGRWGQNAPPLQGQVTPGLYRDPPSGELWWVIQSFDRNVFNLPLSTYPALCTRARVPGEVTPWIQPLGAADAYYTKNAFTGQPDRVTHNGRLWRSIVADVPNVWPPGTANIWADEGPAP